MHNVVQMFCVYFPCNCVLLYRRVETFLGSPASKTLHPVEPEEPFEPFRESSDESADAASSCNNSIKSGGSISKGISSQLYNGSSLTQSPCTSSAFLSSLSPPCSVGTSRGDGGTTGKLNESIAALEDMKGNPETLGTPNWAIDTAVSSAGLRGSPQLLGGLRGGRGIGGRPSPASRLSLVDKKWLERCQVFGEMGAEERPGAGNLPIDVEKGGEEEKRRETEQKETQGDERVVNKKLEQDGERNVAADLARDEGFKNIAHDKIVSNTVPTRQPTGKSKGGSEEKQKREETGEMEIGLTPPPAPEDDGQTILKFKGTTKRGRKRQREGEDMEGETVEEGVAKKKRRNGKKKEEGSDVNYSSTQGGGKKRRAKKKGDKNGEEEEEKETKAPKKVKKKRKVKYLNTHLSL